MEAGGVCMGREMICPCLCVPQNFAGRSPRAFPGLHPQTLCMALLQGINCICQHGCLVRNSALAVYKSESSILYIQQDKYSNKVNWEILSSAVESRAIKKQQSCAYKMAIHSPIEPSSHLLSYPNLQQSHSVSSLCSQDSIIEHVP